MGASTVNPATKYVVLSASNRTRIKARLAGHSKPLSKAAKLPLLLTLLNYIRVGHTDTCPV